MKLIKTRPTSLKSIKTEKETDRLGPPIQMYFQIW